MTEAEARERGLRVEIVRFDFANLDRAVTDGETAGLIKLVVARGGRVLGVSIVGAHAGELILPWVMAIDRRIALSAVAGLVAPYPTLSEISKRAAGAYYAPGLFSRRARLAVKLLSLLG